MDSSQLGIKEEEAHKPKGFRIENVKVSPSQSLDIYGYIAVVPEGDLYFLEWKKYKGGKRLPKDTASPNPVQKSDTQGNNEQMKAIRSSEDEDNYDYNFKINVQEIKSIKKCVPALSTPFLIIRNKAEISYQPLFFVDGYMRLFFDNMRQYADLTQSPTETNVILVNEDNPLTRSYRTLNNSSPPLDYTDESYFSMAKSAFSSISSNIFITVQKFGRESQGDRKQGILTKLPTAVPHSIHYGIGSFEIVDTDKNTASEIKPIPREKPLSKNEWLQAFDKEERITNVNNLKKRIFYGGVDPELRPEVWKFLLGYYPWNSTKQEREHIKKVKAQEYTIIKNQWKSISPEQEANFSNFRKRRNDIHKDVIRTDRSEPHFREIDSIYLVMLHDILLTYSFFNWDIGYAQGMNDLVATILIILENEIDTFWCFKGLMDRLCSNFHKDQTGMYSQFVKLKKLLQTMDQPIYDYLGKIDALNMIFCYRWLLILFRREFACEHICVLWEAFLTNYHHKDFHLFFALAILMKERDTILEHQFGFDGILKHVSGLAEHLNCEELLRSATTLYLDFDTNTDEEVKSDIFDT